MGSGIKVVAGGKLATFAMGAFALSLLPVSMVQADTILGIYAGVGTWQQQYDGDIQSGISRVDIEDDLGLDDDSNIILYIALEHPIPLLPNIRAQYFNIDVNGSDVLSRSIEFNGQIFTISDAVSTTIELSQTDVVFYYELLDNVVSLDVGLVISQIEGTIAVASLGGRAEADFDEILPMLYAKARVDLPLTGLWLGAEAQGLSYNDYSLIEFNAQVGWESSIGLGIEAGYRAVQMELDTFDNVQNAELNIQGPYAALNYHF